MPSEITEDNSAAGDNVAAFLAAVNKLADGNHLPQFIAVVNKLAAGNNPSAQDISAFLGAFLAAGNNLADGTNFAGFFEAVNNLTTAHDLANMNNLRDFLGIVNNFAAGENPYRSMENHAPGTWQPNTPDCCIYRVPSRIRQVKPEAYTPQLVIIGPLHYPSLVEARENRGVVTNVKAMNYLNTEAQKAWYRGKFEERFPRKHDSIRELRRIISDAENNIRASYSESTDWIEQGDFLERIYLDSVFILEFLMNAHDNQQERGEDPLTIPSHKVTIKKDLMLLENQLPYFILEDLFNSAKRHIRGKANTELRTIVERFFGTVPARGNPAQEPARINWAQLWTRVTNCCRTGPAAGNQDPVGENAGEILHFTDFLRRHQVGAIGKRNDGAESALANMYSASKLISGGVELARWREGQSMDARFVDDKRLEIPRFTFDGKTEVLLRNIMALEQCHYPTEAYACNYMNFLDCLIDTEKDVEVLVKKGILVRSADDATVADIVNKITGGLCISNSYLAEIAKRVNACYDEKERNYNGFKQLLIRNYFPHCLGITATIVTSLIVISTVGSFIFAFIEWAKKDPAK